MKSTLTCSNESHEACKQDDSAWSSLLPIGIQQVSACSYRGMEMPGYRLACSNCPACGSTLARPASEDDRVAKERADALWEVALAEEAA